MTDPHDIFLGLECLGLGLIGYLLGRLSSAIFNEHQSPRPDATATRDDNHQ